MEFANRDNSEEICEHLARNLVVIDVEFSNLALLNLCDKFGGTDIVDLVVLEG